MKENKIYLRVKFMINEIYIPRTDGYFYLAVDNSIPGGTCIEFLNGKKCSVDISVKFKLGIDGFLYRVIDTSIPNGKLINDKHGRVDYVEDKPKEVGPVSDKESFDPFKCGIEACSANVHERSIDLNINPNRRRTRQNLPNRRNFGSDYINERFSPNNQSSLKRINRRKNKRANYVSDKYTAEELIEDLIAEIQKYSEELLLAFPERLLKYDGKLRYSQKMLSTFWGWKTQYVSALLDRYKNNNNYRINDKSLLKLRQKINDHLGDKGFICLEILDKYENLDINLEEFAYLLQTELGHITGEVTFTQDEATEILGFSVADKLTDIRKKEKKKINYKFSLWRLYDIIYRINLIFHKKADNCYKLIQKYKDLNKPLKEYRDQKHNVGNPHYFREILSGQLDKAYIFGFMGHDGYLVERGRIGIRIQPKDKVIIDKLIYLIDLDKSKVKVTPETIIHLYKGERKVYQSLRLRFGCIPMFNEMSELGPVGSKADKKVVPLVIKELVKVAKQKALDEWIYTDNGKKVKAWMYTTEGQTALAWLAGAYDADGSLGEYYSGRFYSSQKQYLEEIKDLFDINTKIQESKESGFHEVFGRICYTKGVYFLTINSNNVMIAMMDSYQHSLNRKRPKNCRLSSSELDNYLGSFK